jgi:hypothetical protein
MKQSQNHERKKQQQTVFLKICNNEFTVAGKKQLKSIHTSHKCGHNFHAAPFSRSFSNNVLQLFWVNVISL